MRMAATALALTGMTPTGVAPGTAEDADLVNGNSVRNTASLHLTVDNSEGAGASVVTFVTVAQVGGYDVEDVAVTVPMGAVRVFGHFPANVFGSTLTFTASAAVTVLAYQ
ncbi:hypothetical protein [Streptomyces sp. NPDC101393]|uniref:hypothetical protein n=1 Tax=Streptomyces sp. NPDC101393 TaxID=3366141 RepID=UPI00380B7DB8